MTTISFDAALGIHEKALYLRSQRAEVLANNLANADTPNFKARDVNFQSLLEEATTSQRSDAPALTNARHMTLADADANDDLLYRTPTQPSIDGNTVEEHLEMARFAENSQNFEASLYFLNSRFMGLKGAIRGDM